MPPTPEHVPPPLTMVVSRRTCACSPSIKSRCQSSTYSHIHLSTHLLNLGNHTLLPSIFLFRYHMQKVHLHHNVWLPARHPLPRGVRRIFHRGGGGGRRCGTKTYRGLIAGYTDREDLEAFILSKTRGDQGGFDPPPPRSCACTGLFILASSRAYV